MGTTRRLLTSAMSPAALYSFLDQSVMYPDIMAWLSSTRFSSNRAGALCRMDIDLVMKRSCLGMVAPSDSKLFRGPRRARITQYKVMRQRKGFAYHTFNEISKGNKGLYLVQLMVFNGVRR